METRGRIRVEGQVQREFANLFQVERPDDLVAPAARGVAEELCRGLKQVVVVREVRLRLNERGPRLWALAPYRRHDASEQRHSWRDVRRGGRQSLQDSPSLRHPPVNPCYAPHEGVPRWRVHRRRRVDALHDLETTNAKVKLFDCRPSAFFRGGECS